MAKIDKRKILPLLESIYSEYHKPCFIHPDPLEFLFRYPLSGDREIAGLIASSLATGRVMSILKIVEHILEKIPSPRDSLMVMNKTDITEAFRNFRYRFYGSESLIDFLCGIKRVIGEFGTLNDCFLAGMKRTAGNILPALSIFAHRFNSDSSGRRQILPDPDKGSACKRLNLFLRWMARQDSIDPGGWEGILPADLIIPLDIHMHRIAGLLGFTERKNADMRCALEITARFKEYDSADPARYDFSLTRLGIHPTLDYDKLEQLGKS